MTPDNVQLAFWTGLSIIGVSFLGWMALSVVQLKAEVEATKRQLALVPLADMIKEQLLHALHHDRPGYERPDILIDKALQGTITEAESAELVIWCQKRIIDPKVTEEERIQAELLIPAMKLIKHREIGIIKRAQEAFLSALIGVSVASIHAMARMK
jgi:hypothetical protein